jgi:hypothetical protein
MAACREQFKGVLRHGYTPAGQRHALCNSLAANINHLGIAGFINMTQFIHKVGFHP